MNYKIIRRTVNDSAPLREDGTFFRTGKVRKFASKGEAVAFMIRHLPDEGVVNYMVQEVSKDD